MKIFAGRLHWLARVSARVYARCMTTRSKDHAGRESGFTLLEILVVIAILGLLIGLVAPAALQQLGGARIKTAHLAIERLGSTLDMYKLDVGNYPSSEEGLGALVEKPADAENWNGPYVKGGDPQDPWKHPYLYRQPSERADHDYDLCSRGPQNTSGDSNSAGMICNP